MNEEQRAMAKLNALRRRLAADVLKLSDAEIADDVRAEGKDPAEVAAAMRASIMELVAQARRRELEPSRAKQDALRSPLEPDVTGSMAAVRPEQADPAPLPRGDEAKGTFPPATSILVAMVVGIIVGYIIFTQFPDKKTGAEIAGYFSLISDVFLRLIKMLIGPLVFSTLVVGIARMGGATSLSRVFTKAVGWFIIASLVSLVLGLILGNLLQPGHHFGLPLPDVGASANLATSKLTLKDFVGHLVPRSFAEAMANNEILQIVVFSIFLGVALASLGEKARTLVNAIDELAHAMLKITGYVMKLAPLAVLAAMTATVAVHGLEILLKFGVFMADFYFGLFVLWGILIVVGFLVLGPRVFRLLVLLKEASLLSFATASSEAAYPKILAALDRFGVKRKISSFMLPMGYSFNLNASMMYCTFATLFIAQAYGIELSLVTQIEMLLILMLTSKGIAGVPRASLVVIAATLIQFNIPVAGLLLILSVDAFLDMGRSATNAVGNSIATAVVAKWEGELVPVEEAEESAHALDATRTGAHA